jgi:hypothetical protein
VEKISLPFLTLLKFPPHSGYLFSFVKCSGLKMTVLQRQFGFPCIFVGYNHSIFLMFHFYVHMHGVDHRLHVVAGSCSRNNIECPNVRFAQGSLTSRFVKYAFWSCIVRCIVNIYNRFLLCCFPPLMSVLAERIKHESKSVLKYPPISNVWMFSATFVQIQQPRHDDQAFFSELSQFFNTLHFQLLR